MLENFVRIVMGVSLLIAILCLIPGDKKPLNPQCTTYSCDVAAISFNTEITISCEDKEIGTISGKFFNKITDPLTMKDINGVNIAYAGDTYNFISQNDHGIYVNDKFQFDMIGNFEFLGESYVLKDSAGNDIAYAEFNSMNTYGSIKDVDGNIVAEYQSDSITKDYIVYIYNNCQINNNAVLLVMAAYYSDQAADSE